jgi:hypothetical protein
MVPQSSLDFLRKRKQMPDSRPVSLAAEVAEVLAIQALGFIAQDSERLGRFLAITGIGPADIRLSARDRHFLAGVLDYLCGDEDLLVSFASHASVDPLTIEVARRALTEAAEDDEAQD